MNFDFTEKYTLENDRVRLTPMLKEDYQHFLPFSLNEPELWHYSLTPANGEENLRKYMELALNKRASNDSYAFTIFDKKVNTYAGSTRFYDIQKEHNTLQLGYTWYGKNFQRTGLNRNCKYLLLKFAFETMKVHRVEFRADANNERSIVAMKSIGCVEEGILRSNCAAGMERRDSIVLSILKDKWFNRVKALLESKI